MMRRPYTLLILLISFVFPKLAHTQVDESQTGAWYMYFFSETFKNSQFGFQGDIQHRNWDLLGDLEQLLLRSGLTYQPNNTSLKFTLGYANITTGVFGDSKETSSESRIYQEALLPQKIGTRFFLRHRFRYEQRFVEGQDFRTRWRYAIFLNVPFNKTDTGKGAVYLALYNELFINGERSIGDGRTVEIFDRNRAYAALGYGISDKLQVQLGFMQQNTDSVHKGQMQLSLHHNF